jgi:alkanesulfonate monooxygenase SsuD/methylene tetrahydromethanopterin reductase-like flavin-dependent oxidoreductase (luciferase family)
MVMFADRPWEMRAPVIRHGQELHRQFHGSEPPHIMLTEFCVCGSTLAEIEEEARRYQGKFVESNFYHYEFLGEHFQTIKGYDSYQQKAEIARKGGLEGAVAGFMKAASWGTPDKILRGLEERRELLGDFELNVAFRFGGTPYDVCERGLRLFAKEVLPVLKAQSTAKVRDAAE